MRVCIPVCVRACGCGFHQLLNITFSFMSSKIYPLHIHGYMMIGISFMEYR